MQDRGVLHEQEEIRLSVLTHGDFARPAAGCTCNATALFEYVWSDRSNNIVQQKTLIQALLGEIGIRVQQNMRKVKDFVFLATVLNASDFARPVTVEFSHVSNSEIERNFTETLVFVAVELETVLDNRRVGLQWIDPVNLLHFDPSTGQLLDRIGFDEIPQGTFSESGSPSRFVGFKVPTTTDRLVELEVMVGKSEDVHPDEAETGNTYSQDDDLF